MTSDPFLQSNITRRLLNRSLQPAFMRMVPLGDTAPTSLTEAV
ncbi:hypothetical protein [Oculatella sp. FACHB-28]|nr:hypothetical protein [Oculatella sp. FACHB-28]